MPSLNIYASGANRSARPHVFASGANRTVTRVYVFSGGVNRLVFAAFSATAAGTAPLNKTANASAINSNNITATPTGAVGTVSYVWSIVSHDDPNTTPTLVNSTSQTCQVTTNDPPTAQRTITVTVKCTCTDSGSGLVVITNNVTISNTHNNGA